MSEFAYSVAIKLSLANMASQGLRLIASELLAAHGAATKLEGKLQALKLAAVGYGLGKVGGGMFHFLEKSVDVSKEYVKQLSLMNASGMSQVEIAEAISAAWQTSREVVTSSVAENLKAERELRSVLGPNKMDEIKVILPTVMRTKATMEALSGKEQEGVAFDMIKAIDLRNTGAMSVEAVQRNADLMSRTLMAFGGTLNVHDYHMALKMAKTSGMRLDDTFVYEYLPTLMQEVKTGSGGAQSAGTVLETLRRAVAGGRIQEKMIPAWLDSGMITQSGIGHGGARNRFVKPGAVKGTELFLSNPYEWANEIAAPAIQKLMAKRHVGFDVATAMLFGDRNAEWGLSTFIKKAQQFERDRKLVETAGNSLDTYQKLIKTNPQLASMALAKQWENVQARIGYEILPRLIPYMIKFADGLDSVSRWMQDHPDLTRNLVIGLGAFAIAAKAASGILIGAALWKFLSMGPLLTAALRGVANGVLFLGRALLMNPVGLVITAIAAAAYLLWRNWDVVGPKLAAAWDSIKSAFGALADWMAAKWAWIKGMLPASWFKPEGEKNSGGATGSWEPPKRPIFVPTPLGVQSAVRLPAVTVPPMVQNIVGQLPGAQRGGATGSWDVVPPAKKSDTVQVTSVVKLNEREIGRAVTEHQTKEAQRPQSGTSWFSGSRMPAPVGFSY